MLWLFEAKIGPNILPMPKSTLTAHLNHAFILTLGHKTQDMCHGTIDSGLIVIKSQADRNTGTL